MDTEQEQNQQDIEDAVQHPWNCGCPTCMRLVGPDVEDEDDAPGMF